jgi:hypothetical protein
MGPDLGVWLLSALGALLYVSYISQSVSATSMLLFIQLPLFYQLASVIELPPNQLEAVYAPVASLFGLTMISVGGGSGPGGSHAFASPCFGRACHP